jgi:signal transduction histidine kinase
MLVIAVCLLLTIVFTVRYNAGEHATLFDQYPLVFMRFGMLIDILIFQLVLVRRWIEKEKQLSLEKLQSQLVVEQLRNRISAELHDDIGSTLSGVTMYSHLTARLLETGEHQKASASLTVIRQSVENVVENLRALVWAVQPNQHSLEILLEKLSDFGNNICSASAIRFVYPDPIPAFPFRLTEEQNYDLYLCLKEAINNAAKYSQATVIELGIEQSAASVDFFVRDDGTGFDPSAVKEGNGLGNMRRRARQLGGELMVQSTVDAGTSVAVHFPVWKNKLQTTEFTKTES